MAQHAGLHMASTYMQYVYHAITAFADMFHLTIQCFKLLMLSRELQIASIKVHVVITVNLYALQTLGTTGEHKGQQK
jgi:hypothetical protein